MSAENPTNAELVSSVVGAVEAVQDAQVQLVDGVKKLTAHQVDPEAHGLANYSEIKSAVGSAEASGQIGDPIYLGDVDANTLTETGNYIVKMSDEDNIVLSNHWPLRLEGRTLVRVFESDASIHQIIESIWGNLERRYVKSDNLWSIWYPINIFGNSLTSTIYISKNGSDNNTGFYSDYPVLTVARAIEIAQSITFSSPNSTITFCFGAGEWGDVTFINIPYYFRIAPYDANTPSEYSEELPKFNTITFQHCSVGGIKGIVANKLASYYNSFIYIFDGYKRINSVVAASQGSIRFIDGDEATTVWEIMDSDSVILEVSSGGYVRLGRGTIRLGENLTSLTNNGFRVCGPATLEVSLKTNFDYNGHSAACYKGIFTTGAIIEMADGSSAAHTIDEFTAKLFGNGNATLQNGVIFNGISTGNVNKSGDTMTGDLIIEKNTPQIGLIHTNFDYIETQVKSSLINFYDKNKLKLGCVEFYHNGSKSNTLGFRIYGYPNYPDISARLTADFFIGLDNNGNFVSRIDNVSSNTIGYNIVNINYLNSRLGTGASLTALATLDEFSEDYVETLETKKQKAVAQLNSEAQQAIYAGFPFEIAGQDYIINYSLFDQTNLNGDATLAAQNPDSTMSFRCMDETGQTVWLELPAKTILAIQEYGIVSHRNAIRKMADEKKARIMAAKDEAEIKQIVME